MSEQAQRYDIGLDCEDAWIQRYTDGDYVLYTDYAKLEAECAALREALKDIVQPMEKFNRELKPDERLDGRAIISLLKDPETYISIARDALKASEGV